VILSERFKFIFIKGKRVGGTSVETALSIVCGPDDIVTPIAPIDELQRMRLGGAARNYAAHRDSEHAYTDLIRRTPLHELPQVAVPKERFYNHMPLREVIKEYGPSAMNFEVVCVERSPFAKILSWANWLASSESYLSGGTLQRDLATLRSWIDRIFETGEFAEVKNIDLYRRQDGRVTARVLRHENLENDLRAFLNSRGVTRMPPLPQAKAGLKSDRLDPLKFFSKRQLGIISEVFAEEFKTFGYSSLL
jgi:hypothetical protein